jgi:K+-transporting ATPase ATPase B chain
MTPLLPALRLSLRKLDPRVQLRNPVMFVVEVGAVLTTIAVISHSAAATRRCCSRSRSRSGCG